MVIFRLQIGSENNTGCNVGVFVELIYIDDLGSFSLQIRRVNI